MNSKKNKNGSLTVITGPMFSGKTEELLRRIHLTKHAQKKHLVFKWRLDNRYSPNMIVSHWGRNNEATAIMIKNSTEIKNYLTNDTQLIFVDEVQFFDGKIVNLLDELSNQDYEVIVTGLDRNFRAEPFNEVMGNLLAIADNVVKLTAICQICKEDAVLTQRIINGQPARYQDPLILVGSTEKYEARCRQCFLIYDKN